MWKWLEELLFGRVLKKEIHPLEGPYHLQCPDCKEGFLLEGPKGGSCMNTICEKCGAWFNVAHLLPMADEWVVVNRKDEKGNIIDGHFEKVRMIHA